MCSGPRIKIKCAHSPTYRLIYGGNKIQTKHSKLGHVTEIFRFLVPQVEDEVDDIAKAEFEKFEQTLKESGKPT